MNFTTGLATLAVAIASTLSMGQAQAANEQLTFASNPSARCQPATSLAESQIRKRPLAMINEGTVDVNVNCAFEIEDGQSLAYAVTIWVGNANATAKPVTCTAVSGFETGTNEYLPQTVSVPAGSQGGFGWQDSDFAVSPGGLITVACRLPPGTGINDTYVDFLMDDAVAPPAP